MLFYLEPSPLGTWRLNGGARQPKSGRGLLNTADSAHTIRSVCDMAGILFEDIFDVKDIDPDGKKFERGENILFCMF